MLLKYNHEKGSTIRARFRKQIHNSIRRHNLTKLQLLRHAPAPVLPQRLHTIRALSIPAKCRSTRVYEQEEIYSHPDL